MQRENPRFYEYMSRIRDITEHSGRTYAVGDIHGCAAELEVLLTALVQSERLRPEDLVIFIGDYIDRGPQSKAVVDLLLTFLQSHRRCVFLKGNHEDMLLAYLGLPGRDGMAYLANGGTQCLMSYGLAQGEGPPPSAEETRNAIPKEHLHFYTNLDSCCVLPDYIFAHAGLNPLRDMRLQIDDDLLWIRDEFISNRHFFGRPVVFGHTPYEDVLFNLPYKIGIDTGCVYGNKLTAIEVKERKVLQVSAGATKVVVRAFPDDQVPK